MHNNSPQKIRRLKRNFEESTHVKNLLKEIRKFFKAEIKSVHVFPQKRGVAPSPPKVQAELQVENNYTGEILATMSSSSPKNLSGSVQKIENSEITEEYLFRHKGDTISVSKITNKNGEVSISEEISPEEN